MKYFESRIIISRFILRSKINLDQFNPTYFDFDPILNPFNSIRFNSNPGLKFGSPFNSILRKSWFYKYNSRPARSKYSDRISRPDLDPITDQPKIGSDRPRVLAMSTIAYIWDLCFRLLKGMNREPDCFGWWKGLDGFLKRHKACSSNNEAGRRFDIIGVAGKSTIPANIQSSSGGTAYADLLW
jgi:hypothetical protein